MWIMAKPPCLDYLKKSNIAARETGGITQHIRSFQIETKNYGIMTFIDTPGHEAFTKIRERGSKIADLAILVVAADDGVKPQTIESIEFIKNSRLPFVVAINKSDMPAADPDRVKTQLTESGVVVEDFGGSVPVSVISAKTGKNIPELLELVHLVVSLDPPRADVRESLGINCSRKPPGFKKRSSGYNSGKKRNSKNRSGAFSNRKNRQSQSFIRF